MSAETEIVYPRDVSKVVWERLRGYRELTEGWPELDEDLTGDYSPETKAKLATLFQVAGFGDDGKHIEYGSKLGRNLYLAKINSNIFELMLEDEPQTLVLSLEGREERIPLGYASGYTATYPLNSLGTQLYLENRLAPFEFERQHILSDQSFRCATMAFVGGALYLPMVPDLVNGHRFIEPNHDLLLLWQVLWAQTMRFLPTRTKVVYNDENTVTLRPEKGYQLPMIATAFSGRGYGEDLAQSIGFVRDRHGIDRSSEDRRYLFDLNELNRDTTSLQRRIDLLRAWAWYLQWIPGHKKQRRRILRAVARLEQSYG